MSIQRTVEDKLPFIAACGLVGVALFLYGLVTDQFALRIATKAFPVLALMAAVWTKSTGKYAKTILLGLAFCLVGDLLLEFRQRFFLFGMLAFAAGHIAYIGAFLRQKSWSLLEAIPFLIWIIWALLVLWPGLGKMEAPVAIYTIAIFIMMWRATAVVANRATVWTVLAMLGACVFGFSDTLIALDRFHAPIENARVPIILTYWLAQALIAASTLEPQSAGKPTTTGKTR